jgi:hypothetical protein
MAVEVALGGVGVVVEGGEVAAAAGAGVEPLADSGAMEVVAAEVGAEVAAEELSPFLPPLPLPRCCCCCC